MAESTATPPTVANVATLIRARTVDESLDEIGTFNTTTRPTGDQVSSYITQAMSEVKTRVGAAFYRAEFAETATNLAAIRAAMSVELSHYPEQVSEGQSSYENLRELYESGVRALSDAVRDGSPSRKGTFSIPMRPVGYVAPEES